MKILLTGGFGHLGQSFIKKFHNEHKIIVFNKNTSVDANFINSNNIIIEKGSIENTQIFDVMKKHKPDITLHFASLSGLQKCEENPYEAFLTNVIGTFNVAKACLIEKSKLVFMSSREVYGETITGESSEDDSLNPVNVYGITKMLAEKIILNLGQVHDLNFIILRLTNVYGPGGGKRGVNRIIDTTLQNNYIQINGGNQTLNLIYVDDVVNLVNLILDKTDALNQIFNVGSNDTLIIDEFSNIISNMIKSKIRIEHFPKIDYEVVYFKPDLKKIENILNFHVQTNLEDGLKKTLSYYNNKKN